MKHTIDKHRLDRWFRRTEKEFTPLAVRFRDKPITYVEIGTWGGAASEWVAKNILTHPDSRGFGIDPYCQENERRRHDMAGIKALAATRLADAIGDRYQWIYEPSIAGLIKLQSVIGYSSIDFLYIDGMHEAPDVFQDFALAWPMLKTGSLVIFDDYVKGHGYLWPHVKEACAAIEMAFRWYIKPLTRGRQYAIEVLHKLPPSMRQRHIPGQRYANLAISDWGDKNHRLGI